MQTTWLPPQDQHLVDGCHWDVLVRQCRNRLQTYLSRELRSRAPRYLGGILCGPIPTDALRVFQNAFGQHVPECPRFSLPQLTVEILKSQAKRMKGKAGGPDGWIPELWLYCPDAL